MVVFTRGEKLGYDDGGYGGTGNWKTDPHKLDQVEKVIIYLKEKGQSGGADLCGQLHQPHAPSPEPERVIIYFSHLKEVGLTPSTWPEFGSFGQKPIGFVGERL